MTTDDFSHCAFTGKVQKMSPMMRRLGYEVIHYGNGDASGGASEHVQVLGEEEMYCLLGHRHQDKRRFHGTDGVAGSPLYSEFNRRLKALLAERVQPNELVLHAFGHGTDGALGHAGVDVESGIGYPVTYLNFRIYESYAWMHRDQGKKGREGANYEWVIPNYFVADDWPVVTTPGDYVLFFGRIGETKGLSTLVELARHRPNVQFIICGQGDPSPYLVLPNIHYEPPKTGRERAALLGNARLVLMPSNFVEPFAGVAVEAMLCGTPVAGVTYGAFTETLQQGVTGWRCRVLSEWLRAVDLAPTLDRAAIGAYARSRYSLEAVGPMYDNAFRQIVGLYTDRDWYTFPSSF
jgi:glycosyltransferase involved in cell wall biosynthesis